MGRHSNSERAKFLRVPVVNIDKKIYALKLRDPRWLQKRTEILMRDNWRCVCCFDNTTELHVHHNAYTDSEPWNEKNENLFTLYANCHVLEHQVIANGRRFAFHTSNHLAPCSVSAAMLKAIAENTDEFYDEVMDLFEQKRRKQFPGGRYGK